MSSWHSYPSAFNLGHRAVRDLMNYPHVIEEKIDGSQFSFGLFPDEPDTIDGLRVRSKGAQMNPDAPEKMFTFAVTTVKGIAHLLHPGWTYRAEYLRVPKHNTLAYDRIPTKHLMVFDVSTGEEAWLSPEAKRLEAHRIGLECVPTIGLYPRVKTSLDELRHMLDSTSSVLGGHLIEGVVIKPLVELYGQDHKTLMGKFVSERFREAHKHAWSESNPTSGDILDRLAKTYTAEGRWMKAVQHLRDAGALTDSPKDIGLLIPEVQKDLGQEEKDEIMRMLWKWAWPHLGRACTRGLPDWYKNELLRKQFEEEPIAEVIETV